jgi:hypothetical protein
MHPTVRVLALLPVRSTEGEPTSAVPLEDAAGRAGIAVLVPDMSYAARREAATLGLRAAEDGR